MEKISFYVNRDGEESAKKSLLMLFEVDLRAVLTPQSHASTREYRQRFLDDIKEVGAYLGPDLVLPVMQDVLAKMSEKSSKMSDKDAERTKPFIAQYETALNAIIANNGNPLAVFSALEEHHPLDVPSLASLNASTAEIVISINDKEAVLALLSKAGIVVRSAG